MKDISLKDLKRFVEDKKAIGDRRSAAVKREMEVVRTFHRVMTGTPGIRVEQAIFTYKGEALSL